MLLIPFNGNNTGVLPNGDFGMIVAIHPHAFNVTLDPTGAALPQADFIVNFAQGVGGAGDVS
jgi:hypothetical protein